MHGADRPLVGERVSEAVGAIAARNTVTVALPMTTVLPVLARKVTASAIPSVPREVRPRRRCDLRPRPRPAPSTRLQSVRLHHTVVALRGLP